MSQNSSTALDCSERNLLTYLEYLDNNVYLFSYVQCLKELSMKKAVVCSYAAYCDHAAAHGFDVESYAAVFDAVFAKAFEPVETFIEEHKTEPDPQEAACDVPAEPVEFIDLVEQSFPDVVEPVELPFPEVESDYCFDEMALLYPAPEFKAVMAAYG